MHKKTPTQRIEKTQPTRETAFFKSPRNILKRASKKKWEWINQVAMRTPRKGETMNIHTHTHKKGERQHVLPGPEDIEVDYFSKMKKLRTRTIAIRNGREVAGYTLYQIPKEKPSTEKLNRHVENGNLKDFLRKSKEDFLMTYNEALEELKSQGVRIKFVPNKKRGYIFRNGEFTKQQNL